MTIVAVFNQKGGVGKTTTTLNLAAALARRGRTPYGIDLDPQAHFSAIAGVTAASGDETVLSLFQRNRPLAELVHSALQVDKALRALEPVLKRRVKRRYLLTRFDSRRRMAKDVQAMLEERFGEEVCAARIAENVSLAESPAYNKTVFEHAPSSRGAQGYDALLDELIAAGFF